MRRDQAGSNAVLGGRVFDPFDVPFLPLWPELDTHPASRTSLHGVQSKRGESACVTADGSDPTPLRAST